MRCAIVLSILSASAALAQEAREWITRSYDLGALDGAVPSLRRGEEQSRIPLGAHTTFPHEVEGGLDEDTQSVGHEIIELIGHLAGDTQCQLLPGGQLLVKAAAAQHVTIQKVLEAIVQQGRLPLEIEVRCHAIPPESMDESLRRELALAPAVSEELAERLRALDREQGRLTGSCMVVPGTWGRYEAVRRTTYVPDFDVEIAQGRAIADPVAGVIREGVALAIRPHLLANGTVLARVVASSGKLERPLRRFRPGTTDLGDLELADYRGAGFSTELILRLPAFSAVLLGAPHSGSSGCWNVFLLRLRWVPPAVAAAPVTVLPLGAIASPDRSLAYCWGEESRMGLPLLESGRHLELDEISPWVLAEEKNIVAFTVRWLHGGAFLIAGDPAGIKAAQSAAGSLEAALLHPTRLNVRLQSVVAGTLPDAAAPTAGLLSMPLLAGRVASCSTYLAREFVADYDVEVAQDARIADPKVVPAYGGVFANVLLSRLDSRSFRVRLDMRLSGIEDDIREIPHGAKEVGPIQDVGTRTLVLSPTFDLTSGGVKVIELGPDPCDPAGGRRLFLLATLSDA